MISPYIYYALVGAFCATWALRARRRSNLLPPGPKPLPLIGNILDMPREKEWFTFAEWAMEWGKLVSVNVLGQTMIIVNSVDVGLELMANRSGNYSERPDIPMAELATYTESMTGAIQYGTYTFFRHRTHIHKAVGTPAAVRQYEEALELEVGLFLGEVMRKPEQLHAHIKHMVGSSIMRIAYGHESQQNDPLIRLANIVMEEFSLALAPGTYLANMIPALTHVPAWFPGAQFKKTAQKWAKNTRRMQDEPFEVVREQMRQNTAQPSFTSRLLTRNPNPSPQEEEAMKSAASSLFGGGSDTSSSSIHAFVLAMLLFPDVQRKAQAELDAVVGPDRLPTFADRKDLPYIDAMVLEILRWHPVVPMGVVHRAKEDDMYEGYLIPKGAILLPNAWFMLNNPDTYPEPRKFDPERFIATETHKPAPDPTDSCFGFGRRRCPGASYSRL
ncbi:hypothetical protein HGRIS_004844 [Hohenbuehelia grisea]|uniref:Cytochrome P450 n=1 Tax=Hohenbuehelia grisea TaxID=104357 RepID=A0ABR3JD76_9AGAR